MIKPYKQKHLQKMHRKLEKFTNPMLPMWVLSFQRYHESDFPEIVKRCQQIHIQTLVITNSKQQQIPSHLSATSFPSLRILNLSTNWICSLDILSRVYFPSLTHLFLGFNSITNLNGLSRVYGKQLQYLDLQQNKINNIQPLALLPNSFISQLNLKGNVGLVHLRQLIKCQFYLEEGFFEFTNPPKREKRNLKDIFGKRFKNSTSIKI